MAPSKTTKFNLRWLDKTVFPQFAGWLSTVKDDIHSAHCNICKSTFSLSNMGIGAIKCHARGNEHINILKQQSSQSSMTSFLVPKPESSTTSNDATNCDISIEPKQPEISSMKESKDRDQTIHLFGISDETLKAEILWAMTVVEKKLSLNSCCNISKIFKIMFTDSAIAQQFQLGRDKVSYIIHYGISHYFHETLLDALKSCTDITICFHESLNKVAQKGQMDLVARFWMGESVCTRYFGSVFLGRATAQDLLDNFLKALADIPLSKLLHVSMDGPNVNLALLHKLEEHISNEFPDGKQLIRMGTCGLHVVHGAMKTGLKSVDWDIFGILRNLYYLFKDSPARRAEFTQITNCNVFPKKFCAVRWLENSDCIERAIELVDPIRKYLSQVKRCDSKVKTSLQASMKDPFIKCKLAFIKLLSLQCETFLTNFQSDKVRVHYLYSELSQLLGGIIKKIFKPEKVVQGSSLLKLDLKRKENLLEPKNIDIGFGAKKYLKKLKVTDNLKFCFFLDCQKILQACAQKIIDKSPLKYKLVKGLSSLHPSIILNNSVIGSVRFNIILESFHNTNRITETVAERAKDQYASFCSIANEEYKDEFHNFLSDENSLELDSFYYNILSKEKKWEDLWQVVKLCLILSHGNAAVERGFSVNKTMLVENLKEQSLINQRRAYDGIKSLGGVENVIITKRMLLAVRSARHRYREDLTRKKKLLDKESSKIHEKRKLESELQQLQSEKKKSELKKRRKKLNLKKKFKFWKKKEIF